MTMHIVYLKTHDGNNAGTARYTETSLARRLCDNGVAVPFDAWEKKQAAEKASKKERVKVKKTIAEKPKRRMVRAEKAIKIKK